MEYVYAALLLHKAGQKVDEASIKKVLEAAGVKVDDGRVKALVAALEGVDIEEAIKNAAPVGVTAPSAAPSTSEAPVADEKKADEKKEEEKKEDAAAGLGALFG